MRESAEGRQGRAGGRCFRAYFSAVTATLVFAYLVALPPHFVHHLFQPHHKQAQCVVASCAEHTPQLPAETASPVRPDGVEFAERVPDAAHRPTLALAPADSRAPPLRPS